METKGKKKKHVQKGKKSGAIPKAGNVRVAPNKTRATGTADNATVWAESDQSVTMARTVKYAANVVLPLQQLWTRAEREKGTSGTLNKVLSVMFKVPDTSGTAGTFAGFKSVTVDVQNEMDIPIDFELTFPKNWEGPAATVVSNFVEAHQGKLSAGHSRKLRATTAWDFPVETNAGGSGSNAAQLFRFAATRPNSLSDRFATADALKNDADCITLKVEVEAVLYGQMAADTEDRCAVEWHQDLGYLYEQNGTKPMPPMPKRGISTDKGTIAACNRFQDFTPKAGPKIYRQEALYDTSVADSGILSSVVLDYELSASDGALGAGWYGLLALTLRNGSSSVLYTGQGTKYGDVGSYQYTNDLNSVKENVTLEVPIYGSICLDENNDDNSVVGGCFKWFSWKDYEGDEKKAFVLWDVAKGRPKILAGGYNDYYYDPYTLCSVGTERGAVFNLQVPNLTVQKNVRAINWFSVAFMVLKIAVLIGQALLDSHEQTVINDAHVKHMEWVKEQALAFKSAPKLLPQKRFPLKPPKVIGGHKRAGQ